MLHVPYIAILRVCIVLLARCTHKIHHGWRGGRSTAQNLDSGHLRMSLDVPNVYLIERAPRCLCYAVHEPDPPMVPLVRCTRWADICNWK